MKISVDVDSGHWLEQAVVAAVEYTTFSGETAYIYTDGPEGLPCIQKAPVESNTLYCLYVTVPALCAPPPVLLDSILQPT